jgi:hypothetical protein
MGEIFVKKQKKESSEEREKRGREETVERKDKIRKNMFPFLL